MKIRLFVLSLLIQTAAVDLAAAADALECVTNPPPATVTITYGGDAEPHVTPLEAVFPGYCLRFYYSGAAMWTTLSHAGGVTCNGSTVEIDYTRANFALNGVDMRRNAPAACGPAQACPTSPPPAATGGSVNVYYDRKSDFETVRLLSVSTSCYEVYYGGNSLWFPKSALQYWCDILGNQVGLNLNKGRGSAC